MWAASKNDDSSTNSFEGEYLGTYSYAYHSVDSTEDFNKYIYSSPVWKSCEATIKIIKETDDSCRCNALVLCDLSMKYIVIPFQRMV